MLGIDPERLNESSLVYAVPKPNVKLRFIKGPIPHGWITGAAQLPGKALAVALVLAYAKGLKRSNTIHLTPTLYRDFGLSRHSLYRALIRLRDRKLILVDTKQGRSPIVTILDRDD